jgi:hypothetical protein
MKTLTIQLEEEDVEVVLEALELLHDRLLEFDTHWDNDEETRRDLEAVRRVGAIFDTLGVNQS